MDNLINDTERLNAIKELVSLSVTIGKMPDIIQAGGGNTSIKFGDVMAVKSSGCCLKDMTEDFGYTLLPYKRVNEIYASSDRGADSEKATSALVNDCVISCEGLSSGRPSVEAGFHSALGNTVIHTHAVWANVFACMEDGEQILYTLFRSAGIDCLVLPFINPGAELTFAMHDVVKRYGESLPHIIFLLNHGMVVWADTPEEAVEINNTAIEVLKSEFPVFSYPSIKVRDMGDYCVSTNPFLLEALRSGNISAEALFETPLYPDQLAYLNNGMLGDNPRLVITDDEIRYCVPYNVACNMEESLLAYAVILHLIDLYEGEIQLMPESGIEFITGWDAEKYRINMLK